MRLALATLCLALTVLYGCGSGPGSGPNSGTGAPGGSKKRTVAVIPKSTSHEFWATVGAGARAAAKETGSEILFKAGEPGDDANAQITLAERMFSQADAIVLAPVHNKFLIQTVQKAKEKKVPLVVIDSGVDADPNDYVAYIGTNNKQGGSECARAMGKLLGGTGRVLLFKYAAGSASTTQREEGFRETLAKEFPGIKIAQEKYAEATRDDALKNAHHLLGAQPEFEGVFACNESSTLGMLLALQERKLAGKVKFVGFDAAKEFLVALEKGELHAFAVQNPYKMGLEGVKAALAALEGKSVPKELDTGVTVVTADNVKTAEIQKLVHPPKD